MWALGVQRALRGLEVPRPVSDGAWASRTTLDVAGRRGLYQEPLRLLVLPDYLNQLIGANRLVMACVR